MFKGLKAKIEVERRNQSSSVNERDKIDLTNSSIDLQVHQNICTNPFDDQPTNNNLHPAHHVELVGQHKETQYQDDNISINTNTDNESSRGKPKQNIQNETCTNAAIVSSQAPNTSLVANEDNDGTYLVNIDPNEPHAELIPRLREELIELKIKFRTTARERDQSNNQNVELCQTIENLKNQLEQERESNLSLLRRLKQFDPTNEPGSARLTRPSSHISIKSFSNLEGLTDEESNDVEQLRKMVVSLRSQLSEKNRMLKIRTQNVNDIKKALQKELAEHGKTQEELNKLQNQLKQLTAINRIQNNDNIHNGCLIGDTQSNETQANNHSQHHRNPSQNVTSNDNNNQLHHHESYGGNDSPNNHNTIHLKMGPQLDGISFHSSASVDDYESNELHNHRDVNHEYLRNVLYRYMTSTDTATTLHLVKALSVLMNFTPEQSAAITKSMNVKNSWLRLSK